MNNIKDVVSLVHLMKNLLEVSENQKKHLFKSFIRLDSHFFYKNIFNFMLSYNVFYKNGHLLKPHILLKYENCYT